MRCRKKVHEIFADTYLDISLDIHGVSSLEEAFQKYIKPELLCGKQRSPKSNIALVSVT
jgi:hypothetical protein